MKVSAPTLLQALPAEKSCFAVYADLFKARLTSLVLMTTALGFYLGSDARDYLLLFHVVGGMALVAAGGAALNQWSERDHDARMQRTRERPLPSGRLQPATVLWIGWGSSLSGILYLTFAANLLTGLLAAFTLVTYIFVYTPLKRVTWLNTLVGAVPGALPPLIGWTAARGTVDTAGLSLFAIQACWQIPHFMAIAWIYRDEYARAGFRMLPVEDPQGLRTSRQSLLFTAALFCASLAPWVLGLAGTLYLAAALVLGVLFVSSAVQFTLNLTVGNARRLFYASILYLPLVLSALVLDKN
jgi:protoheme IX farnesyltransferase